MTLRSLTNCAIVFPKKRRNSRDTWTGCRPATSVRSVKRSEVVQCAARYSLTCSSQGTVEAYSLQFLLRNKPARSKTDESTANSVRLSPKVKSDQSFAPTDWPSCAVSLQPCSLRGAGEFVSENEGTTPHSNRRNPSRSRFHGLHLRVKYRTVFELHSSSDPWQVS
jgi:hypothetical protein